MDFFTFIRDFSGLRALFQQELQKEEAQGDFYGVREKIPLIFYDSNFGTRGPTKMTKTPKGKIIFPGPSMASLETGVLYFLYLSHHVSRSSGKGFCNTDGTDWRTKAYWDDLIADRKISAIKMCRFALNNGLKEAKDIADKDYLIFNPSYQSYQSGTPIVPQYNSPSNQKYTYTSDRVVELESLLSKEQQKVQDHSQLISDQRWELQDLRRHYNDKKQESESVQEELVRVMTEFANYAKSNPKGSGKTNINVWKIIGVLQTDDRETIKIAIKKALKMYHPDRVFGCGQLLIELATSITMTLNELSYKIK
jgi:DnaJ-domain-containing protein 1